MWLSVKLENQSKRLYPWKSIQRLILLFFIASAQKNGWLMSPLNCMDLCVFSKNAKLFISQGELLALSLLGMALLSYPLIQ